jgi:hypothetical protein
MMMMMMMLWSGHCDIYNRSILPPQTFWMRPKHLDHSIVENSAIGVLKVIIKFQTNVGRIQ